VITHSRRFEKGSKAVAGTFTNERGRRSGGVVACKWRKTGLPILGDILLVLMSEVCVLNVSEDAQGNITEQLKAIWRGTEEAVIGTLVAGHGKATCRVCKSV
jgi:hypothetical protein